MKKFIYNLIFSKIFCCYRFFKKANISSPGYYLSDDTKTKNSPFITISKVFLATRYTGAIPEKTNKKLGLTGRYVLYCFSGMDFVWVCPMRTPGEGAVQFQFFLPFLAKSASCFKFFLGTLRWCQKHKIFIRCHHRFLHGREALWLKWKGFCAIFAIRNVPVFGLSTERLNTSWNWGEHSARYLWGRNVFKSFLMLFLQGAQARTQGEDL